jgi:tRNA pseudouridine(55) synthase
MADKQEKNGDVPPVLVVEKRLGETPLEALTRVRAERDIDESVPMTYAGRLDPMAEGVLVLLVGEECKKKVEYLGLDKEYEVEIVFGVSTDTYDMLGIPKLSIEKIEQLPAGGFQKIFQKYVGKFSQPYPPFSSKTVNGVQLHTLARAGELPDEDEMPSKEVEIYAVEVVNGGVISSAALEERIMSGIKLVKGDFRQEEIMKQWSGIFRTTEVADGDAGVHIQHETSCPNFPMVRIRVKCSSGTYMRSLAERMGRDLGVGAFALSIKRLSIGLLRLNC